MSTFVSRSTGLGVLAVLVAVAVVGCSGTSPAPSDAGTVDGGRTDAGASDGGGSDAGLSCFVTSQTSCPAGDKCTLGDSGTGECVATGTVAVGQQCTFSSTNVDDCVAGGFCVAHSATVDLCRSFCASDVNCDQTPVASGGTAEPTNVAHCYISVGQAKVCTDPCNPVTAAGTTGCATGLACVVAVTVGLEEYTDCEAAGTGGEGATCTGNADCSAGYTCLNNGTTSNCRQTCRNNVAADCAIGTDLCFALNASDTMFGVCCPSTGC